MIRTIALFAVVLMLTPHAVHDGTTAPETGEEVFASEGDFATEFSFDVDDPEVTQYAYHYGIPVERALAVATWMEDAGPRLDHLVMDLEGNYAEVRIIHGGGRGGVLDDPAMPAGDLRVELRLKDSKTDSAVKAVEAIPIVPGISVEMREVPRSLSELESEAVVLLEDAREQYGVHTPLDTVMDFDAGTVEVVPSSRTVEPLLFEDCATSGVTSGKLDGARAANIWHDDCSGMDTCTSAFPARINNTYGFMTAGHCMDHLGTVGDGWVTGSSTSRANLRYINHPDDVYVSGRAYWYLHDSSYDIGFVNRKYANTTYPGQLWKWDTKEMRRIYSYSAVPRSLGATICVSASVNTRTGEGTYCGIVTDQWINPTGGLLSSYTEYDAFAAPIGRDEIPTWGASGSPAWYGNVVYGIYTSGWPEGLPFPDSPLEGKGYYQQTGYIHTRLEAMSSSWDFWFICWNGVSCNPT